MFLSEWREFPSALCLAGKRKLDDSSRLDVVEIARVNASVIFSFLVGVSIYQHPCVIDSFQVHNVLWISNERNRAFYLPAERQ